MVKIAPNLTLASLVLGGALCVATLAAPRHQAFACGEAEGTGSCSETSGNADEARWLLKLAVAALQVNEREALDQFTHGTGGLRTVDLYVFCVGPDGRMSAHPDPAIMGRDARTLRDPHGNPFATGMLDVAREGAIVQVNYLYPGLGSSASEPKMSFVTRVKDQVCGVGYYRELTGGPDHPPSP